MRWQPVLLVLFTAFTIQASTEEAARKILASRCWACHTQTALGGLRLDSRPGMLKGGKSGAALIPGNAAHSRIFQAVAHTQPGVKPMPPGVQLDAEELRTLEAWIQEGAPWNENALHWSFQPLRPNQPNESIDGFISKALQSKSIPANTRADKRTLIRRIYFDVTGLPPTEQEFQAGIAVVSDVESAKELLRVGEVPRQPAKQQ